jgi:hypothetical protein
MTPGGLEVEGYHVTKAPEQCIFKEVKFQVFFFSRISFITLNVLLMMAVIVLYHEQDEANPHAQFLFKIYFNVSSHLLLGLPGGLLHSGFSIRNIYPLPTFPCLLYSLPIFP